MPTSRRQRHAPLGDQVRLYPAPGYACSGDPQQYIEIPLIDDTDPEGDETFAVTFSNPTGGAALSQNASCTVTIYGMIR